MGIRRAAVLDIQQVGAQALADLVAARAFDGLVLGDELADTRDHGRRATGEDLHDLARGDAIAPFVDTDGARVVL